MVKTVHLRTEVPKNREVTVVLPPDVHTGPADLIVLVAPKAAGGSTLGDLLRSEFHGSWRERDDLGEGPEFARKLREEAWKRLS